MKSTLKFCLKMKFLLLYAFMLGSSLLYAQTSKLVILHTNDMHSKLTGYGPESDYSPLVLNNDKTVGGFARLATVIKQTRAQNPDNMLLLDDGDFLMGSIFHAAEPQTAFQLQLMKKLGYDYVGFGNHEFDYGPGALASVIQVAHNAGNLPNMVSSNMIFSDTSNSDNALESLFKSGLIKPYYVVEKKGIRIGIFSLMGIDAASVAPGSTPVTFANPQATAKAMVKLLKEKEKADYIICLSHSGIYGGPNGSWIFEDVDLANKVQGIDLIVSGHTHVTTIEPYKVKNTYIVQAGAYVQKVGYLELEFNGKQLSKLSGKMIDLDDKIDADAETHEQIEKYKEFISQKYFSLVDLNYDKPLVETQFPLVCDNINKSAESNLGPLMADAIYYYINHFSPENTNICMVASGTIREDLVPGNTGLQTAPDIFRVASLGYGGDSIPGYPLSTIYVTGKELKGMVEVLLLAQKSPDSYIYYSGIKIYYNPDKMMLRKVKKIEIQGEEIDFSDDNKRLYGVSANVYLLSFVGRIKTLSKGLVTVVPKLVDGTPLVNKNDAVIDFDKAKPGIQEFKEWLAIVKYMQSFPDTNGNGIPDVPDSYKNPASVYIKMK